MIWVGASLHPISGVDPAGTKIATRWHPPSLAFFIDQMSKTQEQPPCKDTNAFGKLTAKGKELQIHPGVLSGGDVVYQEQNPSASFLFIHCSTHSSKQYFWEPNLLYAKVIVYCIEQQELLFYGWETGILAISYASTYSLEGFLTLVLPGFFFSSDGIKEGVESPVTICSGSLDLPDSLPETEQTPVSTIGVMV